MLRIKVVNLTKNFGFTQALKGVSFEFQAGQIFGFVGPNGAGKTTCLRILATLDDPSEGEAYINDIPISQYPERIHHLVGFVPDALPEHSDITVHEYLDFFARAYKLKGELRRQRLEGVETFTRLHAIRDKLLKALSKGMKQRVSLARALVHDPAVLLMDEPAAGLDPRARIELRELLRLLAAQDKAILISSHILTELTEICDGAIIIEQGTILCSGSIDQLIRQDRPHLQLLVRPHDDPDALSKVLLEMPQVIAVRPNGPELRVEIQGDEKDGCDLLAALIHKGCRIAEFKQKQANLEELFMHLTSGEVR